MSNPSALPSSTDSLRHRRSRERFATAWTAHQRAIESRCRRLMAPSRLDADDAVALSALRIYRALTVRATQPKNLRAWMLRIAFTTCMDLHRATNRRCELTLDLEDPQAAETVLAPQSGPNRQGLEGSASLAQCPFSRLIQQEVSALTSRWIDELPERLRASLCVHLESQDATETAQRLGIQPANARKRVQQAREILRRRLADYRANQSR